jgi:hypothetical protein
MLGGASHRGEKLIPKPMCNYGKSRIGAKIDRSKDV